MKRDRKAFEAWANKQLQLLLVKLRLTDHNLDPIQPSNREASECLCRYPYKDIQIRYSEEIFEYWKNGKKTFALQVLTHEMCHVLTDPLYVKAVKRYISQDDMEDERERLTDHIANIIFDTL